MGDFVWAFGAWRLIRVLAAVASRLRSLIDVSPFPFDRPFVECYRFLIDLVMLSACVMVGFGMCLCWKTTVPDTLSALILLTQQICAR